jgi:hypothetical protein
MGIKNGPNLNAAKEREEDVNAENPPDRAFVIVFQLVLADVVVKDTNSVPIHLSEIGHRKIQRIQTYIMPKDTMVPKNEPKTTSHAASPPSG